VREFVTDVPRERVLTVGSVASPTPTGSAHTVHRSAVVADVLPSLLSSDAAIDVVDDTGRAIGSIDRDRVAEILGRVRG
jgi:hypothetical protein